VVDGKYPTEGKGDKTDTSSRPRSPKLESAEKRLATKEQIKDSLKRHARWTAPGMAPPRLAILVSPQYSGLGAGVDDLPSVSLRLSFIASLSPGASFLLEFRRPGREGRVGFVALALRGILAVQARLPAAD